MTELFNNRHKKIFYYAYYIYIYTHTYSAKKDKISSVLPPNHAQRLWPVAAGHRQIGRDRGGDAGAKGPQRAAGQGTRVK